MRQFIAEHRLLLISGIMIVGFFSFALSQGQSGTESSDSSTSSFRTANSESPMFAGSPDAPVSIIQYSDFLCPSCSIFSTQVMPAINKDYISTEKANIEFRPMAFIADGSLQAGMGGYCAIDQGKFWEYHDGIYEYVANEVFTNGKDPKSDVILTASLVTQLATKSGLDGASFGDCLTSRKYFDRITESNNEANKNGVTGTPYIMVNGQVYQGSMSLTAFEALLKTKL
ncbi:hypothetical protein EOL96_00735 [Candidatus Saccharibacteria bacterium]|nr:hypothetical protein [Candidatus Saccharibacteria bacterium]